MHYASESPTELQKIQFRGILYDDILLYKNNISTITLADCFFSMATQKICLFSAAPGNLLLVSFYTTAEKFWLNFVMGCCL